MVLLRNFVKYLYWALKFLFYPLVFILARAVPDLRRRPQFIVSIYTLVFFGILSDLFWRYTPTGILLFLCLQLAGAGLALLFLIWGGDFEERNGDG